MITYNVTLSYPNKDPHHTTVEIEDLGDAVQNNIAAIAAARGAVASSIDDAEDLVVERVERAA